MNDLEFISYKKILVFGSENVGKTSLIMKMERNKFDSSYKATEKEVTTTRLNTKVINNKTLNTDIFEVKIEADNLTSEQIEIYKTYLFDCQCALYMVDLSNTESFNSIKQLIALLKPEDIKILTNILIFNKSDLEIGREIKDLEIQEFKNKYSSFEIIEISLKNDNNYSLLLDKMYNGVNNINNKDIPINYISEFPTNHKEKTSGITTVGTIRVVLLGDSMVGKTAFLTRYFKNTFNETFLSTIGIDDENKFIKIVNSNYKLTVWDTAGQERFRSLPKKYYQNADGILLLFDVCKEESFKNVSNWIKDIHENSNVENDKMILFLIGNKIDIKERSVSKEEAERLANELHMEYYEVSCKININVSEVMCRMIKKCAVNLGADINKINLKNPGNANNAGCCSKKKK